MKIKSYGDLVKHINNYVNEYSDYRSNEMIIIDLYREGYGLEYQNENDGAGCWIRQWLLNGKPVWVEEECGDYNRGDLPVFDNENVKGLVRWYYAKLHTNEEAIERFGE